MGTRANDIATLIKNGSQIDSDAIGTSAITAEKLNVGQIGGRKNLIINGAMQVSQRYGTIRTFVTANANGYTLDRWNPGQFQQAGHQQVSVTDSSVPTTKAVRVTSSSTSEAGSGTRMAFGQIVEHANCDFVAGKTVTLSLWIKFSNATIAGSNEFSMQLSEYDTIDPDFGITGADRTNDIFISNGSYPTTWTKYTKTITCASTVKNIGARFAFSDLFNTSSSGSAWYEITAVQLELGDTATPFEHRSYAEELALCQRYYFKPNDATVQDDGSVGHKYGISSMTLGFNSTFAFPVKMRTAPTASEITSPDYVNCSGIIINTNPDGYISRVSVSSNGTYRAYNWLYDFEAEL